MVEFKIVISDPKSGKSYQQEVKDDNAKHFLNKRIGEKVKGELLDMTGYEFEIKGGSDKCGFPMRKDVKGTGRKEIFAVSGVGMEKKVTFTKKGDRKIRRKRHGVKQKKTVCGNTIHEEVSQINLMVIKHGSKPLGGEEKPSEGEAPKEEAKPTKEKPVETPKQEEKKEEPKAEAPKKEEEAKPAEEKKVEEKKEEPKAEEKSKAEEKPAPVEEKKEEPAKKEEKVEEKTE
ncbi:hypothetical protein HN695_02875 [Candidatus Woesearchaeota archaeon]|jgi:small subunit ribosomal protein S6e|nr:hypothetical protein [Candidatus Woesearchaeota archaeon]MBT5272134.1 hypothetical protein [Candidatus Woesearchaeota archaeon]MBT6040937.1 hypothetical protein [Candidatus Woesearchaeota archaeon]MBT6336271.1 hypothetical protein [Candidatus Woesearchaeota archaeon]MBT7927254.1 hypothetical protein [Candidatus Woesearchaeota archaeon]